MNNEVHNLPEEDIDYFRDTPIRYLGYANEVGEAFRQLIPRSLVRFSYGIASLYCLSDASSKAHGVKKDTEKLPNGYLYSNRTAAEMFIEAVVWQGLASVVIPGFTINRICWGTSLLLRRSALPLIPLRRQKLLVTAIGLVSIPVIIKPIDQLVDKIIDKGVEVSSNMGIKHQITHDEKFHVILEHEGHHHHHHHHHHARQLPSAGESKQ